MRVGQKRKRIGDLADAQIAMLLKVQRLELAIKKNFAKRLLAACGGRHGHLRVFHTIRAVSNHESGSFATAERKRTCSAPGFSRGPCVLCDCATSDFHMDARGHAASG